jgi:hypothetical protein
VLIHLRIRALRAGHCSWIQAPSSSSGHASSDGRGARADGGAPQLYQRGSEANQVEASARMTSLSRRRRESPQPAAVIDHHRGFVELHVGHGHEPAPGHDLVVRRRGDRLAGHQEELESSTARGWRWEQQSSRQNCPLLHGLFA